MYIYIYICICTLYVPLNFEPKHIQFSTIPLIYICSSSKSFNRFMKYRTCSIGQVKKFNLYVYYVLTSTVLAYVLSHHHTDSIYCFYYSFALFKVK